MQGVSSKRGIDIAASDVTIDLLAGENGTAFVVPYNTSANQTATDPGGFSYAHMPPVGNRRVKWGNTFAATEAIIGNRGPQYTGPGGATGTWTLIPAVTTVDNTYRTPVGVGSNTLLIHGGRTTWEGNIAYNDNHVSYESRPDPETTPFTFTGLPVFEQCFF